MPRWDYTIELGDIFHNDDLTFAKKRAEIVKRLKASRWYRDCKDDGLGELVDELERTRTAAAFDRVWADVYDQADQDRAWIDTLGPVRT